MVVQLPPKADRGVRGGRPWRRCRDCGSHCYWSVDAWVCRSTMCGSEWYPDHDPVHFAEPTASDAEPGGRLPYPSNLRQQILLNAFHAELCQARWSSNTPRGHSGEALCWKALRTSRTIDLQLGDRP